MDLVLATTNKHKIRELRAFFKGVEGVELYTLLDFPDYVQPEETGSTFEENASLKALDAANKLNHYALADDSGLVVPALNGRPGIHSARFAGKNASDRENRLKLLQELQSFEENRRDAYYSCTLALASPQGILKVAHGFCEGSLLFEERGSGGFGFDPLFVKFEYSKTFAELDEEIKNRISHRRKAFDKLLPYLQRQLLQPR